jgi:hypothetical protein
MLAYGVLLASGKPTFDEIDKPSIWDVLRCISHDISLAHTFITLFLQSSLGAEKYIH